MTFISIIIPFNQEKRYLKDCLQSLKEENLEDMETIIILNGISKDKDDSTNADTVNALIREYEKDLNVVVKSFDEPIGVAKARNEGLEAASGEYVYFIDGDDYIYHDALNKLISIANETNADFINGERVKTYYIQERFEEELKERKYKPLKMKKNSDDMKFAISLLVLKNRRDIELLSALHSLIKREILTSNSISFDENKRYFSDYSFMMQVVSKSKTFKSAVGSVYAKRQCEDILNYPNLSQDQGEDIFSNSIKEYENNLKTIDFDDSNTKKSLEKEINKKLLNYYLKDFSNKFRLSENSKWRGEYFELMAGASRKFNHKNHMQEIQALQNHDLNKVDSFINKRHRKSKIKRIKKIFKKRDKTALNKLLYEDVFNKRKVKSNRIIFESFRGDFYSDSPKYIYEYLLKNYKNQYDFVWVINNENADIPGNPKKVRQFSLKYFYYYATSKYWVINRRQSGRLKKRPEQVILSTWHGTPLKRLGLDLENVYAGSPKVKRIFYNDSKKWNYLVSPNRYTTNILRSAFGYDGEILETGYPRNDILYNADEDDVQKIKNKLNIPLDKKVILYAPTWREDEFDEPGQFKLTLKLDLDELREKLGDEYILIIRAHYYVSTRLDLSDYKGFAYDFSSHDDIAELYLASDILITDYSSVFFDFANLKRPILFYPYDLDKYGDIDRGFYIDIHSEVPGPLLFTTNEVIDSIKNIDIINEEYKEKYEEFYNRFCNLEDGTASKKIVDEVWKK